MNLLADVGAQPGTVQSGLVTSAASGDTAKPTSVVTSPVGGNSIGSGTRVMITGTAADSGGVVAGVEVSVDGGTTWHTAQGRANWSYDGLTGPMGQATIRTRAIDDSGNIEVAGSGVTVIVTAPSTANLTSGSRRQFRPWKMAVIPARSSSV